MRTSTSPAATREQLLDVAERNFSERDFTATTTRQLASQAGCNVALISYYFGGKDGLYQELLERFFRTMREAVKATREATAVDPKSLRKEWPEFTDADEARFCAAVFALFSSVFAHARMHKVLFREMMNGGKNAIKALQKSELGVKGIFEEILAELKAKKKLRADLSPGFMMLTLLGPAVYSSLAEPVLSAVYRHPPNDAAHARTLAVYLTRTLFDGWS